MPIRSVTVDFWQTLYDSSNGAARNAERKEALRTAIAAEQAEPDPDTFERVYNGLWEFFDGHWLGNHRTPTSREMIEEMLRRLGAHLSEERMRAVVTVFEEGILAHPPSLLPGAAEALEFLSAEGRRLALISDTAFSPGSVLRRLMERDRIVDHFDVFIFSDETGFAKPHPEAFFRALAAIEGTPEQAVHIGDIERTDIRGAKGIGMGAVLYRDVENPHKYAEKKTEADVVIESWAEVHDIFDTLPVTGR